MAQHSEGGLGAALLIDSVVRIVPFTADLGRIPLLANCDSKLKIARVSSGNWILPSGGDLPFSTIVSRKAGLKTVKEPPIGYLVSVLALPERMTLALAKEVFGHSSLAII